MATFLCPKCEHTQEVAEKHIGKGTRCPKCKAEGRVRGSTPIPSPPSATNESNTIVLRSAGGSIRTQLSRTIQLNQHSSLQREFITIIDPTLPIALTNCVGVKTAFERETDYSASQYVYTADFAVKALRDVRAFEVRFLLFNVWGLHVKTLSSTDIVDVAAGTVHSRNGKWHLYDENEACEHYASIAFVATVRSADGGVYNANQAPILEQAQEFSSQFTDADLEPTPARRAV